MTSRSHTRIGSDEARKWARKLRLNNPYAKSVIVAAANYVNENGVAYPGIETLSQDTDISEETVIGRLRWCESIGAIALFKNWVDENGVRNRDGRGRVTSSEIRFLMDVDPDVIEVNATAKSATRSLRGAALRAHEAKGPDCHDDAASPRPHGEQTQELAPEISPRHQREQNPVSPRLAPDQPPPPATRTEEQKKEDSPPNPPAGGERAVDRELEEFIGRFVADYPAPITNLPRLRTVLAALTDDERPKVLTAARGYAAFIADCERKKKPRAVKDAHTWVANGLWQGYLATGERAEVAARMQLVAADSREGMALLVLHRIARLGRPIETEGKFLLTQPLSQQALALADAPPDDDWVFVPGDERNRCGSWNDLIARELPGKPRPTLITDRNPGGVSGFMAPWDWPPRKDGTLCDAA